MKVATWNVNGIRARAAQLSGWLAEERPDVLCLQELKAEPEQIPDEVRSPDYHVYWHGMKGYSGVSLHLRRELCREDPVFTHPAFDMEARIVQVELHDLVIASVYVPNGGKDYAAKLHFLRQLVDWTASLRAAGRELILCGDINIAHTDLDLHPKERKPGVVGQRPEERELFDALLGGWLTDIGRKLDPENPGLFTWWAPWRSLRARNIGWRIDYVLTSPRVTQAATACAVRAAVGTSDHAPVVLESSLVL